MTVQSPSSAAGSAAESPPPPARGPLVWSAVTVIWGAVVLAGALTGTLAAVPTAVLPLLVVAGIAVPVMAVRRSSAARRFVATVDLAHLTWFNAWRVPAAAAFFFAGTRALLPERFVGNAAWGDLVAGILAPLVVLVGRRLVGDARRRLYLGFHLFSFGDFVLAVGTGLTFTLLGDRRMDAVLDTPLALIVLWGVPITGAISLLALHRLLGDELRLRSRSDEAVAYDPTG